MTYVHILEGTSGRFYIGSTQNIEKRLDRHNSGMVHSTKRIGIPLKLIVYKEYSSVSAARSAEVKLKRWKNPAKAIEYLKDTG